MFGALHPSLQFKGSHKVQVGFSTVNELNSMGDIDLMFFDDSM